MDNPHETSLLVKAVWSAIIVLGISAIAERVSTRVAGLLAGAPLSAVLFFFFVGRDMGVPFIVQSIPHAIAAFSGTVVFVLAYYWASSKFTTYSVLAGTVAAITAFLVVAGAQMAIPVTLFTATTLTMSVICLAVWILRHIEFIKVTRPVRFTARLLFLRGGLAAAMITIVIALAETLGSRWTGLLVGFPTALLPTLLIIHTTYGAPSTHAIIRNFPLGMGSIIFYILTVRFSFPVVGVYFGTAAALAASFTYLTIVMFAGRLWTKK
jgi:uncharacterized membrane protein (GlpM family)